MFHLTLQALIEMVDWKDADIMVKYYRSNPLKINGKGVKVSLSSTRKRIRSVTVLSSRGHGGLTNILVGLGMSGEFTTVVFAL